MLQKFDPVSTRPCDNINHSKSHTLDISYCRSPFFPSVCLSLSYDKVMLNIVRKVDTGLKGGKNHIFLGND